MSYARNACEPSATSTPISETLSAPPPGAERLVCLNFKVPLQVRHQFKVYAARHNITMTELLLQLLDDCLSSDTTLNSYSAVKK
jgi:hypothetical protein